MKKIATLQYLIIVILFSCQDSDIAPIPAQLDENAVFTHFNFIEETLPTSVNVSEFYVKAEVGSNVDVSQLTPDFTLAEGYTAFINGEEQIPGQSPVNFTNTVTYTIKQNSTNRSATWNVNVSPLNCKIIIDASHGGGTWWYPQGPSSGYDPDVWHQGTPIVEKLTSMGFEVYELGRGEELKEEMFMGYYIVIRTSGFHTYTENELEVYKNLLERGTNLALFTDHKKNDRTDELAEYLGIQFEGIAGGTVSRFNEHPLTQSMEPFEYRIGSVLMNANENPNINVLAWLGENDYADINYNGVQDESDPMGMPVMGTITHPTSQITFFGDMNTFQFQTQPYFDNLVNWLGACGF